MGVDPSGGRDVGMAQQLLRFQLAHVGLIQDGRELVPELVGRDVGLPNLGVGGVLFALVVVFAGDDLVVGQADALAVVGPAPLVARAGQGSLTAQDVACLLYTSPSPRDETSSRMPSSA